MWAVGLTDRSIAPQSRNRACGFWIELPHFGKNKCSKHTYERKAYAAKKKSALAQAECRAAHAHDFASPAPLSPLRTCPLRSQIWKTHRERSLSLHTALEHVSYSLHCTPISRLCTKCRLPTGSRRGLPLSSRRWLR